MHLHAFARCAVRFGGFEEKSGSTGMCVVSSGTWRRNLGSGAKAAPCNIPNAALTKRRNSLISSGDSGSGIRVHREEETLEEITVTHRTFKPGIDNTPVSHGGGEEFVTGSAVNADDELELEELPPSMSSEVAIESEPEMEVSSLAVESLSDEPLDLEEPTTDSSFASLEVEANPSEYMEEAMESDYAEEALPSDYAEEEANPSEYMEEAMESEYMEEAMESEYEVEAMESEYEVEAMESEYEVEAMESEYEVEAMESEYEVEAMESEYEVEAMESEYEVEAMESEYEVEAMESEYEVEAMESEYEVEAMESVLSEESAESPLSSLPSRGYIYFAEDEDLEEYTALVLDEEFPDWESTLTSLRMFTEWHSESETALPLSFAVAADIEDESLLSSSSSINATRESILQKENPLPATFIETESLEAEDERPALPTDMVSFGTLSNTEECIQRSQGPPDNIPCQTKQTEMTKELPTIKTEPCDGTEEGDFDTEKEGDRTMLPPPITEGETQHDPTQEPAPTELLFGHRTYRPQTSKATKLPKLVKPSIEHEAQKGAEISKTTKQQHFPQSSPSPTAAEADRERSTGPAVIHPKHKSPVYQTRRRSGQQRRRSSDAGTYVPSSSMSHLDQAWTRKDDSNSVEIGPGHILFDRDDRIGYGRWKPAETQFTMHQPNHFRSKATSATKCVVYRRIPCGKPHSLSHSFINRRHRQSKHQSKRMSCPWLLLARDFEALLETRLFSTEFLKSARRSLISYSSSV